MANLYSEQKQNTYNGSNGGLASIYAPKGGIGTYTYIDVTNDYPWTLNKYARANAPIVVLREFQVNETQISRALTFYNTAIDNYTRNVRSKNVTGALFQTSQQDGILTPYEQLYQKDFPTGFVYSLPYFSDINFELNTPSWEQVTALDEAVQVSGGLATLLAGSLGSLIGGAYKASQKAAIFAAGLSSPISNVNDFPKAWAGHEPRRLEITFSLFNTVDPDDWLKNRELCELLINQNLYNKKDFITGIPPVFYEVIIPGQHYSYASCITNITVLNKGNMRVMNIDDRNVKDVNNKLINSYNVNVPDVYEVKITLEDLVIPSKNLFQSINNPTVVASIVDPKRGFAQSFTQTRNLQQPDLEVLSANLVKTIQQRAPKAAIGAVQGATNVAKKILNNEQLTKEEQKQITPPLTPTPVPPSAK